MKPRFSILMILLLLSLGSIVSACVGAADTPQVELTLAPESALPDFLDQAPAEVREVYRFAITNPDVLSKMPCYCGCGAMGHQNNLHCYIKEVHSDGSIEFEPHAYGWSTCTDITRDVMQMMREGKELTGIRDYIDAEYSKYGPSTDTEPIQESSFSPSGPNAPDFAESLPASIPQEGASSSCEQTDELSWCQEKR